MNVVQEIERIKTAEAKLGIFGGLNKASWHEKYRNSAWVYVGGLSYELSEGDVICFMSQWGEIEDINLVREKDTGKSMGFCFVKYEDQRSTVLAVDNFNGISLLDRTLRVDHVDKYKLPKDIRDKEEAAIEDDPTKHVSIGPGHAYIGKELANDKTIESGVNLWEKPKKSVYVTQRKEDDYLDMPLIDLHPNERKKKNKDKEKKKHKRHRHESDSDDRGHKRRRSSPEQEKSRVRLDAKSKHFEEAVEGGKPIPSGRVSSLPAAPTVPVHGAAPPSSWRGRYDPSAASINPYGNQGGGSHSSFNPSVSSNYAKKNTPSDGPTKPKGESIFESTSKSFGGMNRRR